MSKRHAYLIMAHNQFKLLGMQLDVLDHERNDFYIHVDLKSKFDLVELRSHIKKGNIYFTKRIKVNWGGYSQVHAEMILLQSAMEHGEYAYYHLLTGVDFPLKCQDEILEYFDAANQKQFISSGCNEISELFAQRVKYYRFFRDMKNSRNNKLIKGIDKLGVIVQRRLRVNRIDKGTCLRVGSAYFDITQEFAEYVISKKGWIEKTFKKSFCADELFISTLWQNWEKRDENMRYRTDIKEHKYIEKIYLDVNRAIDWTRGMPYTYRLEDYKLLMTCGCLFARKFDYEHYPEIVDKIYREIKK